MSIGLATAVANELRRKHYRAGLRTILLEAADTNRCPQSENLSLWTKSTGTGAATGGFTDPLGGTSAYKLDDQDAAVGVNWQSANLLAYGAGPTQRGYSVYVKADTSSLGNFGVFDVTGAVYKARFNLVNTAGVITAALEFGTGSVVAVLPSTDQPGWYRVLFVVTGLTIANTHRVILRPTDVSNAAAVGAMFFWGVMAHEVSVPAHSYVQNNTNGSATANSDDLQLPWDAPPGAISLYAKYREVGMQSLAIAAASSTRILQISSPSALAPRLIILHPGAGAFRLQHEVSAGTTTASTTSGTPTLNFGDLVEAFGWVYADGSAQVGVSINVGAPLLGARSAAIGFPSAWSNDGLPTSQVLRVGASGGSGFAEWAALGLFPGLLTLDEMRSLAS